MALRSGGRKLSYEILSRNSSVQEEEAGLFYRSNSDPIRSHGAADHIPATPRRKRRKKKRTAAVANCSIPESPSAVADDDDGAVVNGLEFNFSQTVLCSVATEVVSDQNSFGAAELRQRTVNAGAGGAVVDETTPSGGGSLEGEANAKEDSAVEAAAAKPNGNLVPKLQMTESLDWQRVMAEDPNCESFSLFTHTMCVCSSLFHNNWLMFYLNFGSDIFSVDKSPLRYFMEEMSNGNSLRSTTTLGNEKERERVYDTIFRLPWRCELVNFSS